MSSRFSPRRSDGLTGDMFANIPTPAPAIAGGMDYRTQVAVLIGAAVDEIRAHDPEMDRSMIAAKVSRLTGKDFSKATLDGYTAESRDAFNMPAYLVPAFETVCNSTAITSWLASMRGGRLVLGPEAIDAEIGRIQSEAADLNDRLKTLRLLRRSVR